MAIAQASNVAPAAVTVANPRFLVIRCSSADPVADEQNLRIVQIRTTLWHPLTVDARAHDLAVQVRVVRTSRLNAIECRILCCRPIHDVRISLTGDEDHSFLPAQRVMAPDARA